jgi:cytochrome P450
VSVYLSVAPPDGFIRWSDADWESWLRDHPWEAAERLCSRGDWSIFLYQVRKHCPRAGKAIEPLFAQLVNERPLSAQETEDLRDALHVARDELEGKPAAALNEADARFAGAEGLQAMVAAARARLGKEPSLGDVWADLFSQVDKLLENAVGRKRGIYFGNV